MPAPTHLLPVLELLGDGGTVDMAERIHQHTTNEITAALTAANLTDIAALTDQLAQERAAHATAAKAHAQIVTNLQDEIARRRADHDGACALVAQMHAAALGETRGPIRGVVEDIADLRAELLELRAIVAGTATSDDGPTVTVADLEHEAAVLARHALAWEAAATVDTDRDPEDASVDVDPVTGLAADGTADDDDEIDWDDPDPDAATAPAAADPKPEPTTAEIRAWCLEHGVPVAQKGAINAAARQAYDAAHAAGE